MKKQSDKTEELTTGPETIDQSKREFLANAAAAGVAAGAGALGMAMQSAQAASESIKSHPAGDFDLVILNGRVMDPETQYDAVANVAVKDGRIVSITNAAISGRESIDATGHVVAPGFIDTHWHNDRPWSNKLALRDGRTTVLDLEIGTHGPYIDQWYRERVGNNQTNFGQSVGHEYARAEILDGFKGAQDVRSAAESRKGSGWSNQRPTLEQGNRILQLLDEGLQAGGLGIGSTLGYMRDGVSPREFFELQMLAGRYGRQTGAHFRYTPGTDTTEANGIQELLANAAALGAPALACHFNNPGYNVVHELLVRMRERGMNVWGEVYPYAAGSTALNAVFLEPEVWVKQLGYKYEETIKDPITGEWYTQKSREEMLKKDPTRVVLVFKMPESAILDWLQLKDASLITDGMPMLPDDDLSWDTPYEQLPNTHPRAAGSYAKAFRLARENNIPLMQIVAMSSYNSARPLGMMGLKAMQERGRMQEGMVADITIFDPQTIADRATYEKGTVPSTGIPYVLVNGTIVVKESEVLKGVHPGQPIRYERQESHFEPLKEENWKQTFYAVPVDFGGGLPNTQPKNLGLSGHPLSHSGTDLHSGTGFKGCC